MKYVFTSVDRLEFSVALTPCKGGSIHCVRVHDETGALLTGCIGSGSTPEMAKTAATINLSKAIQKIAQAREEAA
jgi:hypothetical protein